MEVDSEPLKGNADVRELFLGLTDIYQSKDGKQEKVFDALEWLAAMCSHVPDKGEQMVRYYGFYSNVSRGKRKKQDQDGLIPSILEPVESPSALSSEPKGLQVERPDGSSKARPGATHIPIHV